MDCGMVTINDFALVPMVQSLPFGGCKESGYGRFNGEEVGFYYDFAVDKAALELTLAFVINRSVHSRLLPFQRRESFLAFHLLPKHSLFIPVLTLPCLTSSTHSSFLRSFPCLALPGSARVLARQERRERPLPRRMPPGTFLSKI
jgi:hypothetical protein